MPAGREGFVNRRNGLPAYGNRTPGAGGAGDAAKVKRTLREQVGECLTCSIGLAPNVFLGKVASDIQKPDGLGTSTR